MIGIYKIISPSGKIYIGSSKNVEKRITHYKKLDCKGQKRLYNSISKYTWENHIFEILEECLLEDLYRREAYYGNKFEVLGKHGLNCILPKENDKIIGISENTRIKMSESKKGSKNTFYGKTHSEHVKELISKSQTGRKHSLEHRKKVSENSARSNSKIVLDMNTGIFYNSATEAALLLGYVKSTLRQRLNGFLENNTSLLYV